MRACILIPTYLLSTTIHLCCQTRHTVHYSPEDGLSSNHVYAAFQDHKGYIWFATNNGLSKFDGKRFRNYTSNNGLPDNDIFDLKEDLAGRLWLSCYNGEPCYILNNKIYTSSNDSNLKSFRPGGYFKLHRFQDKLLLSRLATGVNYEVSPKPDGGYRVQTIPIIGEILVLEDSLILNHLGSYYLYDNSYHILDSITISSFTRYAPSELKPMMVLDKDCFAIYLDNGYCQKFKVQSKKIVRYGSQVKPEIFPRCFLHDNKLWVSQINAGLLPLTKDFKRDHDRPRIFSPNTVCHFLTDREDNYWACTPDKGVYMMPNMPARYCYEGENIYKLAHGVNTIYVGYYNGKINTLRGDAIYKNRTNETDPESNIRCLLADSDYIVVGTTNELKLINKKANTEYKTGKFNSLKCVAKAGNYLFIGTHNGCYRLSLQDFSIDTVFNARITALLPLNDSSVYLGTTSGLYLCKNKGKSWASGVLRISSLEGAGITTIQKAGDVLAVGTVQKGLILVSGNEFELVNLGQGSNKINCNVLFTEHKNIWVGTFTGLFKITRGKHLKDYKVERISGFNGLLSNIVNDVILVNDTLYIAGPKGITILPQHSEVSENLRPLIYIDNVAINGVDRNAGHSLDLPRDSNIVEVYLSAIDFKSLGNVAFRYRVRGLNENWTHTPNNFVRFESLPPGHYTFEVMAMNSRNIWSPPAFFSFHIHPAWWQKGWFKALILLFLAVIAFAVVRIRLIALRRKNEHKRKFLENELKGLWNQINPHFIFNTLNSIQEFIINHKPKEANYYLSKFADLVRTIINHSKRTFISIEEEIDFLKSYVQLERLRYSDSFNFELKVAGSVDQQAKIPSMLIQPVVENAIKYGVIPGEKHASLKVEITEEIPFIVFSVEDNGPGRDYVKSYQALNNRERESLGLKNVQERLQLLGNPVNKTIIIEDLIDEEGKPSGTRVKIYTLLS